MYKLFFSSVTCVLFSFYTVSSYAYDSQTEIVRECKKIPNYATQGGKLYQEKNYTQALKAFKKQAAWAHFCSYHEDVTRTQVSAEQLATAYNNVGLTHQKLGQPRWAKAWYSIMPETKKSQFNLSQLPSIQASKQKSGSYVRYAGQGEWNTLQVTEKKDHYQIDFFGLRMGLMALMNGPNMGEFSIKMPKNSNIAQYRYEDCKIQLQFQNHASDGERIKVTQNENTSSCGFGFGVYAEGNYLKVETQP